MLYPKREETSADGSSRKAHYGFGEQVWDTVLRETDWAPAASAFQVLRYLRRNKGTRDHDIESARWYYERLLAGSQQKQVARHFEMLEYKLCLETLMSLLSEEEKELIQNK